MKVENGVEGWEEKKKTLEKLPRFLITKKETDLGSWGENVSKRENRGGEG